MSTPIVNKVAESGLLSLDLTQLIDNTPIVLFDIKQYLFMELILKEKEEDLCSALKEQNLQVIVERSIDSLVKLETELKVNENDHYFIVLLGVEKSKQSIDCQFHFLMDEEMKNKSWPLNLVYNESIPVYHLFIRDKLSKNPIEARIVLQGSNEINGIYRASDLEMNMAKKVKGGLLRVDAEGYLSADFENATIPMSTTFHDTIWLNPIQEGMLAELDDVYFAAGLATVLEESYPKLKRLRDFLILNPAVSIEIHGHVNEDNGKDIVSMKLSKKRQFECFLHNEIKQKMYREPFLMINFLVLDTIF